MLQVLCDLLLSVWVTFSPKNTLGRNAFRLVMRATEAVTSGQIIWDHSVVAEPLEGLRTGLFLSVTAHMSFHYPPKY